MTEKLVAVTLITLIEAAAFLVGIAIWFHFAGLGHPVKGALLGTLAWTVLTELEHLVAVNYGSGKPLFSVRD